MNQLSKPTQPRHEKCAENVNYEYVAHLICQKDMC